jgi:hemolysin D
MVSLLRAKSIEQQFEHPLVIRQTNTRSRLIIWLLMGAVAGLITWANVSKIEEAILVQGKLEPKGASKEVKIPVNGVIKEILAKEGTGVKAGDVLLRLDPTTANAQLESLRKVRTALEQENQYYQAQIGGPSTGQGAIAPANLSPQMLNLAKSREAILAENRLANVQMGGESGGAGLSLDQQARLRAEARESATRQQAAQLEVQQLQQQVEVLAVKQTAAESALAVEEKIYADLTPLIESGSIGRLQYLKQQQSRDERRAQVLEYQQEQLRLQKLIDQAEVRTSNAEAVDTKEFAGRIGANNQRLAEIDSQISKQMLDNSKRIAEIDSQISQSQQILKYSEVKAPVDGVVFNLKPSAAGYVASPDEVLLTILPNDQLVAKVSITNQDIGHVKPNMDVDVRVDSFPFSEFGDVKGTILAIGSDALPPTETQPFYTFPAKIELKQHTINVNGQATPLKSGMSISANVRLRERSVMSIFTGMFTKTAESMKFVR